MSWRYAILIVLGWITASALSGASDLPWSPEQIADIAAREKTVIKEGTFWRIDTPRFIVRSAVDAHFTAELSRYLDLFTQAAEAELDLPPPREQQPADVTVYDSQGRYQRGIGSLACSRGQFDWFYTSLDASPCYTIQTYIARPDERSFDHFCLPILNHEVTHFLLQSRAGRRRIPDAIHEGVATYMQAWDAFRNASWNREHRHSAFAGELKRSVAADSLPGFSSLLAATRWDIDNFGPQTNERYASAESFIAFLHAAPSRLAFFHSLMLTAFMGGDTQGLVSTTGAPLEREWRNSLRAAQPTNDVARIAPASR